jgi:hypothetical protein
MEVDLNSIVAEGVEAGKAVCAALLGFAMVTKDAGFRQRSFLPGSGEDRRGLPAGILALHR